MSQWGAHLADPALWAVLALVGGGVLAWQRQRRLALGLLAAALGLWGLSSGPGTALLLTPLENRYPALLSPPPEVEAVVLLTGGEGWAPGRSITSSLSTTSAQRLLEAVRLWRLLEGRVPILFVGGIGEPGGQAEAPLVAQAAQALGVPATALRWEAASRNTYENILAIRERFPDAQVLLVTNAFHMPRAMALCGKLGVNAIPAPCGYHTRAAFSPWDLFPASEHLWASALAIREYLALAWYRLLGRI
ncbi:MAG TPA: YdcF family protein [Candidatus Acetothermia bacterium]|nr:YdcF family protein [Candidatus Acetothermia bacterium]